MGDGCFQSRSSSFTARTSKVPANCPTSNHGTNTLTIRCQEPLYLMNLRLNRLFNIEQTIRK